MGLEKTKVFYDELKRMTFFQRLFGWGKVVALMMESYSEIEAYSNESANAGTLNSQIKSLNLNLEERKSELNKKENELTKLNTELKSLNKELTNKEKIISKLEESESKNTETINKLKIDNEGLKKDFIDTQKINTKLEKSNSELFETTNSQKDLISSLKSEKQILEDKKTLLTKEVKELTSELAEFKKVEQKTKEEADRALERLQKTTADFDKRRQELEDEETQKETERFEEMKKTWKLHEDLVEQEIRAICHRRAIDYFDKEKVPFKGKPDNTIQIAGEFVVFDAKAPANDNLDNFPKYIKTQAESLKKYAKQKDVKKDIFLVVPTNTINILESYYYDMSDYRVFVVTIDSLEPIILSLRKIEDYEFVDQMTPEQREDVARIIGKFAHNSKRRLQIDAFMADQTIDLLRECGRLPEDILESSQKHEMSLKLNPPMEKRAKKTDLKKLAQDNKKLKQELNAQNVNTKIDGTKIESIDLYGENK